MLSVCMLLLLASKSCPTLCDPMDSSPPGSMGFSMARMLEWVAISLSKGPSWPRGQTQVSCLAGRFFTTEPPLIMVLRNEPAGLVFNQRNAAKNMKFLVFTSQTRLKRQLFLSYNFMIIKINIYIQFHDYKIQDIYILYKLCVQFYN